MSLELLLSLGIASLASAGWWLLLRARTFDVILGLTLVSYAVNLFLFAVGRLNPGRAPLLKSGVDATLANHTDPLPQALVLTAIVISMAMTALLLAMAIRSRDLTGSDHVDGAEPPR